MSNSLLVVDHLIFRNNGHFLLRVYTHSFSCLYYIGLVRPFVIMMNRFFIISIVLVNCKRNISRISLLTILIYMYVLFCFNG